LFYLLLMNKGATFKQIHKFLFSKNEKSVVYKFLNKMHKRGFIDKALSGLEYGQYLYFITTKALKDLEIEPYQVARIKFKSDKPKHDLLLINVIKKFKSLDSVEFINTDNELKMDFAPITRDFREDLILFATNSDAVITFRENERIYYGVLELELSSKSEKRYQNLIHRYQKITDLRYVFYICKTQSQVKKLKKIVKYETFNQEGP